MVDLNPNINNLGLNTPIKKQIEDINFKKDPTKCCLQETYFWLNVKGRKKICNANTTYSWSGYINVKQ